MGGQQGWPGLQREARAVCEPAGVSHRPRCCSFKVVIREELFFDEATGLPELSREEAALVS